MFIYIFYYPFSCFSFLFLLHSVIVQGRFCRRYLVQIEKFLKLHRIIITNIFQKVDKNQDGVRKVKGDLYRSNITKKSMKNHFNTFHSHFQIKAVTQRMIPKNVIQQRLAIAGTVLRKLNFSLNTSFHYIIACRFYFDTLWKKYFWNDWYYYSRIFQWFYLPMIVWLRISK